MSIFNKFKKKDEGAGSQVKPAASVAKKEVKEPAPVKAKAPQVKVEKPIAAKKTAPREKEDKGILIRPIITEKATNLSQFNQYVFEVAGHANKIQVAEAIEGRYNVKPVKVNIVRNKGKAVSYGMHRGQTKDTKKAIIILPEGQTIQIREGV